LRPEAEAEDYVGCSFIHLCQLLTHLCLGNSSTPRVEHIHHLQMTQTHRTV